ncbi:MAG: MnhB domain-containing protein [Deltaproteobacteria bacterium]
MKAIALCICAIVGYFLLLASPDLPNWGDPNSPASTHVSPYYIKHSMEETDVPNFVTSVLADYRGYDTMFETTVIFCAGLTVLSVLRRSHRAREKIVRPRPARRNADIILQEASRLLLAPMQLFALYVIAHGHHSPGGGFQGGVILGSSFILLAIVYDLQYVLGRISEKTILRFSGIGVSIYAGIGALCLLWGGNFLAYASWSKVLPVSKEMAHSYGILGVEIGVAITVMAIMLSLYLDLASNGEMDEGL